MPIGFDDLRGTVVHELLDEVENARSKCPGSSFPKLESPVGGFVCPANDFVVVGPAVYDETFQMSHREEVAEEDLVSDDCLAAND